MALGCFFRHSTLFVANTATVDRAEKYSHSRETRSAIREQQDQPTTLDKTGQNWTTLA